MASKKPPVAHVFNQNTDDSDSDWTDESICDENEPCRHSYPISLLQALEDSDDDKCGDNHDPKKSKKADDNKNSHKEEGDKNTSECETINGDDLSVDSDDDEVVIALKRSKIKKDLNLEPIITKDIVTYISFNPTYDQLAIGTLNGQVRLYDYKNNKHLLKLVDAKSSIRSIEWTECGTFVYICTNRRIYRMNTAKKSKTMRSVKTGIHCMQVMNNGLITGDENGTVSVWDERVKGDPVFKVRKTSCTVTSIDINDPHVVATTDSGYVISFDFRYDQRFTRKSNDFTADLNCCGFYKNYTKLVCGTSDGSLLAYSEKNKFTTWEDEYKPAGPDARASINCMIPITDTIALTGMDNGIIYATNLYPMRRLGIIGSTQQLTGKKDDSIECMDISSIGDIIGVSCMTKGVLLFNISYFATIDPFSPKYRSDYYFPSSGMINRSEFFSGLDNK